MVWVKVIRQHIIPLKEAILLERLSTLSGRRRICRFYCDGTCESESSLPDEEKRLGLAVDLDVQSPDTVA